MLPLTREPGESADVIEDERERLCRDVAPVRRGGRQSSVSGRWAELRRWALRALIAGSLAVGGGGPLHAQDSGATTAPETFLGSGTAVAAVERVPVAPHRTVALPVPTVAERRASLARSGVDAGRAGTPGPRPPLEIVGVGRDLGELMSGPLAIAPASWVRLADGGLATALSVASRGAMALRLQLRIRGAPDGLAVRVYDPARPAGTVQAVPGVLPGPAGEWASVWTPTVPGEVVAVEFYLAPGVEPDGLEVEIPRASHFDGAH